MMVQLVQDATATMAATSTTALVAPPSAGGRSRAHSTGQSLHRGSLVHLQGDFDLDTFAEQSNLMFTGLGSLMNCLLKTPQPPQQDTEAHAQSTSPVIASAGRAWLSQLPAQLTEHGIQVHGSLSTLDEANP